MTLALAVLPCDACVRRTWLIAALAANIERAARGRRDLHLILALPNADLIAGVGGAGRARVTRALADLDPGAERARTTAASITAICRHDPRFPPALLEMPDAPAILHVAGDPGLLPLGDDAGPSVAIVGARRASPDGLEIARSLARDLAVAGVKVVSGMALGVDSAAHEGALDAGGATLAVLAGGAERPYPARKRHVYRRIVETGAVVSELPVGFTPHRWCFPARNRLIAALAELTVVVEATARSGSLITADFAAMLGRTVAAVPGRVTNPLADGTNSLLYDGAQLVRDARDVLELAVGPGAGTRVPAEPALEPELRAILGHVRNGRTTPGAIAARTGNLAAAADGLVRLELEGRLRRDFSGRYVIVP